MKLEYHNIKDTNDLPNEEWRVYPGNSQYLVSCFGRVKSIEQKVKHNLGGVSIKKERIMTQTDNGSGYLSSK